MDRKPPSCPRRFRRCDAGSARVSARLCERPEARLRNISIGGACFQVEKPVKAKRICRMTIEAEGRQFDITGLVVWSRNLGKSVSEGSGKSYYTVGVLFNNRFYGEAGRLLRKLQEQINRPEPEEFNTI